MRPHLLISLLVIGTISPLKEQQIWQDLMIYSEAENCLPTAYPESPVLRRAGVAGPGCAEWYYIEYYLTFYPTESIGIYNSEGRTYPSLTRDSENPHSRHKIQNDTERSKSD